MSQRRPTQRRTTSPTPSIGRRVGSRWRRVRRFVLLHRRLLAAGLATLALLTGIRAASMPPAETTKILVAATDLPGGRPLSPSDVAEVQLPVSAAPVGAVTSAAQLEGRTLASPLNEGEPVTDVRLVAPGLLDGYPGMVAAPVRIADAAAARLVVVGDRVDLLAVAPDGGAAQLVADAAPVVAVPGMADGDGLVGGALLVVAVSEADARALAESSVRAVLSIVLNR